MRLQHLLEGSTPSSYLAQADLPVEWEHILLPSPFVRHGAGERKHHRISLWPQVPLAPLLQGLRRASLYRSHLSSQRVDGELECGEESQGEGELEYHAHQPARTA